jgi:hypothetical protein
LLVEVIYAMEELTADAGERGDALVSLPFLAWS